MPILNHNDLKKVEEYQNFVRTSPFANATQDLGWEKVKDGWIGEQVYLEEDGKIIAAMSLIIRRAFAGFSLMYAPRAPICDFSDTQLVKRLLDEAKPLAKEYRAFVLRFDPELPRLPQLEEEYRKMGLKVRNDGCDKYDLIQPRYNMILNLDEPSFDELMPHFSEKTRYNIRLAARKGVTVHWSRSEEDLKKFFDLYEITAVRDKIGHRPYEYFKRMVDAYGSSDLLRIYIAEHEGEPLSGAICIHYGNKTWYIYGASSNNKRNLMPNYAMQAEMIRWGFENGSKIYDFGGVFILDKTNGLYKFKEGFCRREGATEFIWSTILCSTPALPRCCRWCSASATASTSRNRYSRLLSRKKNKYCSAHKTDRPLGVCLFFCSAGRKVVKMAKFKSGFRGYSIIFVDNYKKEIDETDKN